MIAIHFLQPDTPLPMNGLTCCINASSFQAQCLLQYWQRGRALWSHSFDMPQELIDDSMNRIKLGINFSGIKPLSPKAQQWVMQQPVYIPLHVQIIEGMRSTGTTLEELNSALGIRIATISDFLTQKTQMNADYIDKILAYITSKHK
jgi:hypothetical protein